jgi:uncharacterized protein
MHASIEQHRDAIADICRRFGVRRLEAFGSAARATDFHPDTSDADFLVEFVPDSRLRPLEQFFGLTEALEQELGRSVDLVEPRGHSQPLHPRQYR